MTNPTDSINGCIHGAALDVGQKGLTKREYFAVMAMQGFVSSPLRHTPPDYDAISAMSLDMADALIAKLNA